MRAEIAPSLALALATAACTESPAPSVPLDESRLATLISQCADSGQHIHEWARRAEDGDVSADMADGIRLAAEVCAEARRSIKGAPIEPMCGPVVEYLTSINRSLVTYVEERPVGDYGPQSSPRPTFDQARACEDALSPFSSKPVP